MAEWQDKNLVAERLVEIQQENDTDNNKLQIICQNYDIFNDETYCFSKYRYLTKQ